MPWIGKVTMRSPAAPVSGLSGTDLIEQGHGGLPSFDSNVREEDRASSDGKVKGS